MIWLAVALLVLVLAVTVALTPNGRRRPATPPVADGQVIVRALRGPLPDVIAFVDVETTGLYERNRVVSFAAIKVITGAAPEGGSVECLYLVFDPEQDSHPKAQEVHGFDDWDLMHQEKFAARAGEIVEFLEGASLLVSHNAEFDFGFLAREFDRCGLPPLPQRKFCTMEAFRGAHPGQPGNLGNAAALAGGRRLGSRHNALEDAGLAMQVFFWLHGRSVALSLGSVIQRPANLRLAPPKPSAPPKPMPSPWANLNQTDFYAQLKVALDENNVTRAEEMLLAVIALEEFRCHASRDGVRYKPYLELAKLYYRMGCGQAEVDIVQRYLGQPMALGAGPDQMCKRLAIATRRLPKKSARR
jgi:DNA polymerase-3 subunit epsilon